MGSGYQNKLDGVLTTTVEGRQKLPAHVTDAQQVSDVSDFYKEHLPTPLSSPQQVLVLLEALPLSLRSATCLSRPLSA